MDFALKSSVYGFIDLFKGYSKDEKTFIAIITPSNYTDECLVFFQNEPFMNFVTKSREIKVGAINVVPIDYVGKCKFDAILVITVGMNDIDKAKAFETASHNSFFRAIFSGFEKENYFKLSSNTKTTEIIDSFEDKSHSYLELGTSFHYYISPSNKYRYVNVLQINLLVELDWDSIYWNTFGKNMMKNNIIYSITDIKNRNFSYMHYVIGSMIYKHLDSQLHIDNGTIFYFKKTFYMKAQNSKMRSATDGSYLYDDEYEPFETNLYNIVGFRLMEKTIRSNSSSYQLGPQEMFIDIEKRKDYWGKYFLFDKAESYL